MKNIFLLLFFISSIAFARVENPLAFIGEVVKGATNGAPLSTDANGKLASGIVNGEVSSTSSSTCTTTDGVLNSMTVTPAAGTYLVMFSSDFNSTVAGLVITLTFNVGGTNSGVTQRKFMPFTGGTLTTGSQRIMSSLHAIITVNGSQAIAVHCATSSSTSATASMQLDYVRLQ